MQVGYNFHDKNYPHNDQENINLMLNLPFSRSFLWSLLFYHLLWGITLFLLMGHPKFFVLRLTTPSTLRCAFQPLQTMQPQVNIYKLEKLAYPAPSQLTLQSSFIFN